MTLDKRPDAARERVEELEADLGDSQFWVDRRVACISGGYPPSEANFVSVQEYVRHLERIEKERDALVDELRDINVELVRARNERGVLRDALQNIAAATAGGYIHRTAAEALAEVDPWN